MTAYIKLATYARSPAVMPCGQRRGLSFSIPIPSPYRDEWVAWVCVRCSTYSTGLRNQILISTTVSCTTRMDEWGKHAKGFVKHSDFSEIF